MLWFHQKASNRTDCCLTLSCLPVVRPPLSSGLREGEASPGNLKVYVRNLMVLKGWELRKQVPGPWVKRRNLKSGGGGAHL